MDNLTHRSVIAQIQTGKRITIVPVDWEPGKTCDIRLTVEGIVPIYAALRTRSRFLSCDQLAAADDPAELIGAVIQERWTVLTICRQLRQNGRKGGNDLMENWTQLYLSTPADRETVAQALFRAGYTVRQMKKKEGNKTVVYIEYCKTVKER